MLNTRDLKSLIILIIPESATISFAVNPLFEKKVTRSERLNIGDGSSVFAALKLAVVESLLPNTTIHEGPPN